MYLALKASSEMERLASDGSALGAALWSGPLSCANYHTVYIPLLASFLIRNFDGVRQSSSGPSIYKPG